ncbi:hypothetical protein [Rhizobium leguminosarum]|uniref:hypothetical protein n=1 Tax=Rhizobium leguminosarum TaxID=384 RepID=UPI001AE59B28|nr:hypothetical protein [Rhizobium leguminosarum]MBP2443805.1 site-specific recombinase XerD [Rhizobium leguminosarum]
MTIAFERTTIQQHPDGFIVYNRSGNVILAVTMYLMHLLVFGRARSTVHQYGRQIVTILRSLEASDIDLFKTDDHVLSLLNVDAVEIRRIKVNTWTKQLYQFLKMLAFAQAMGFCDRIIGHNQEGQQPEFRISLLPGEAFSHALLKQRGEGYEIVDLPTDDEFRLVEAELLRTGSIALRQQRLAMLAFLRAAPSRRCELAALTCTVVPTRAEFDRQRREQLMKNDVRGIRISFYRAKKEADRKRPATVPLSTVEQLINFRDRYRPALLKAGKDPEAMFVSAATGERYNPQSLTNMFKIAAASAQSKHGGKLKRIRVHHYRHRAITTMTREFLLAGMDVAEAFFIVMAEADVTFDVMCIYLHLAKEELDANSEPYRKASLAMESIANLHMQLSYRNGGGNAPRAFRRRV